MSKKTIQQKLLKPEGRKRDRAATERAILKAAGELFASKGYENTRTLEIAKASGANEALITRYFGGKEGLLVAILTNAESFQALLSENNTCCKMAEVFSTPESGLSISEAVEDFLKQGNEIMSDREQFMRIATSRALVDPEVATAVRSQIIEKRVPIICESFAKFLDPKKVTKEEVESAVILMATANFMMNFMGRRVYRVSEKKIQLAIQMLGHALETVFSGRTSAAVKSSKKR